MEAHFAFLPQDLESWSLATFLRLRSPGPQPLPPSDPGIQAPTLFVPKMEETGLSVFTSLRTQSLASTL